MKNKGLGRGLSALISEKTIAITTASNAGVQSISINDIIPCAFQPRRIFNDQQLEELALSIKEHGVIQPIILNKHDTNSHYMLIAGERRWRASKLAGLKVIPAIIKDITDKQVAEFALIENIQRADLGPLEEAEGYQKLIHEFSYTQDHLSKMLGKSRSHIANILRLLQLPDIAKQYLSDGHINFGHAKVIAGSKHAEAIAKDIVAKGLNVRQTEELVKNSSSNISNTKNTATKPLDSNLVKAAKLLSEKFNISVSITPSKTGGKIILSCDSSAKLQNLANRMLKL